MPSSGSMHTRELGCCRNQREPDCSQRLHADQLPSAPQGRYSHIPSHTKECPAWVPSPSNSPHSSHPSPHSATHRSPPTPAHILQLTALLRPRPTFWAARNRRSSSYQSALRCSVLSVNSASTAPSATATSFVWRGSKGARSRACRGAQIGEAWGYAAQPRHTPAVKGEQKQQSCSRPG